MIKQSLRIKCQHTSNEYAVSTAGTELGWSPWDSQQSSACWSFDTGQRKLVPSESQMSNSLWGPSGGGLLFNGVFWSWFSWHFNMCMCPYSLPINLYSTFVFTPGIRSCIDLCHMGGVRQMPCMCLPRCRHPLSSKGNEKQLVCNASSLKIIVQTRKKGLFTVPFPPTQWNQDVSWSNSFCFSWAKYSFIFMGLGLTVFKMWPVIEDCPKNEIQCL